MALGGLWVGVYTVWIRYGYGMATLLGCFGIHGAAAFGNYGGVEIQM